MIKRVKAVIDRHQPGAKTSQSDVLPDRRRSHAQHPLGLRDVRLVFARQLEQAGLGLLARVSKVGTAVLLQSAAAGAQSTLRALDRDTPSGAFVGPARFGQFRGPPELLDVYASARDPATAARVWQLTEQALGDLLPV